MNTNGVNKPIKYNLHPASRTGRTPAYYLLTRQKQARDNPATKAAADADPDPR